MCRSLELNASLFAISVPLEHVNFVAAGFCNKIGQNPTSGYICAGSNEPVKAD
jgi:hypothetical protein